MDERVARILEECKLDSRIWKHHADYAAGNITLAEMDAKVMETWEREQVRARAASAPTALDRPRYDLEQSRALRDNPVPGERQGNGY